MPWAACSSAEGVVFRGLPLLMNRRHLVKRSCTNRSQIALGHGRYLFAPPNTAAQPVPDCVLVGTVGKLLLGLYGDSSSAVSCRLLVLPPVPWLLAMTSSATSWPTNGANVNPLCVTASQQQCSRVSYSTWLSLLSNHHESWTTLCAHLAKYVT